MLRFITANKMLEVVLSAVQCIHSTEFKYLSGLVTDVRTVCYTGCLYV